MNDAPKLDTDSPEDRTCMDLLRQIYVMTQAASFSDAERVLCFITDLLKDFFPEDR